MGKVEECAVSVIRPGSVVTVRNVHDASDSFSGIVVWHSDATITLRALLRLQWPFHLQTVQIPTLQYVVVLERPGFEGIDGLIVHEISTLERCTAGCEAGCKTHKGEMWSSVVAEWELQPEVYKVLSRGLVRVGIRLVALRRMKLDQRDLWYLSQDH